MDKNYANFVFDTLDETYRDAKCELNFNNNFELLIAVMLSAQCTDKRVNMVTPVLFSKFGTSEKLANADRKEVEAIVKTCGFYRNKSKNIILASQILTKDFGSQVPSSIEDLIKLPGVGRKTANVMLSVAYDGDAIAVDTHVFRVSNRLGLTNSKTPEETERQLTKLFDQDKWSRLHHYLVHFGRYRCKAIKPECDGCKFASTCKKGEKNNVSR